MLPALIATETVVRLRATTTTDAHNNPVRSWSSPSSLTIDGCSVQPAEGDEYLLGREQITSRWKWFGPSDADVLSTDRLRHASVDYEVDGSVQLWPDHAGLGHKWAYLKKVAG